MFVYVIKASRIKFFAVVLLSVLTLVVLISLVPKYETIGDDVAVVSYKYGNIKTNTDRIEFISQFGYTVNPEPAEICDVIIPEDFDSVYESYNEIQRKQGLNLKKYKGKTAVRYTYVISNYKDAENTVMINVIVYKNKVIGGDVCCLEGTPFMHGFELENN